MILDLRLMLIRFLRAVMRNFDSQRNVLCPSRVAAIVLAAILIPISSEGRSTTVPISSWGPSRRQAAQNSSADLLSGPLLLHHC